MIKRFLNWIREVLKNMISKQDAMQAVGVDIALTDTMAESIELWGDMYQNQAYWLSADVKSLGLAAAVSSELARVATIEMTAEVEGSARAEYLQTQIAPVVEKARHWVEYAVAKGGIILKPYPRGEDIIVDYVQADQFLPVNFDGNGNITAAAFVDNKVEGNAYYTRIEYHEIDGDLYTVRNKAYRSTSKQTLGREIPLTQVADWAELEPEVIIAGVDRPLFAYWRYPMANTIEPFSPLGVSCFSRAVELIRQADEQWGRLIWEFTAGEMALYVSTDAFKKDDNGNLKLPNKRLYKTLDVNNVGSELFEAWAPALREQSFMTGLNEILRRIEFTCGLAYGTLSNPEDIAKTATEIKMAKQRSYATITDIQKETAKALDDLLAAIDIYTSLLNLAPKGAYTATYNFDDSVITDQNEQLQRDMQLVAAGLMTKVEFRMRNFHEKEEVARKAVEELEPVGISFFPDEE